MWMRQQIGVLLATSGSQGSERTKSFGTSENSCITYSRKKKNATLCDWHIRVTTGVLAVGGLFGLLQALPEVTSAGVERRMQIHRAFRFPFSDSFVIARLLQVLLKSCCHYEQEPIILFANFEY